jgi:hypothetical protein
MNRHRNYLQSRFPRPTGKISGPTRSFLFSAAFAAFIAAVLFVASANANDPSPVITVKLEIDTAKISGGEKNKAKLSAIRNGNTQPLTFRLESNNQNLAKFLVDEVTFRPEQTDAMLEIGSRSTPIRTTVIFRATLDAADQNFAEQTLELVPARMKSITLSSPSMFGIEKAQITCTVELRAPAPMGGIELYLSRLVVGGLNEKNLHLNIPNPRVDQGKTSASFAIKYEDIRNDDGDIHHFNSPTSYNQATRTNDLYIGVDPGGSSTLQPTAVPGFVLKTTFTVAPLKVASISVQPNSISGGSEALATFTLNTAPLGSNEVAHISPRSPGPSNKTFARLLGSSCQSVPDSAQPIELALSQGVSTYSFKVCSIGTTTPVQSSVSVKLRSGVYSAPVTVNQ